MASGRVKEERVAHFTVLCTSVRASAAVQMSSACKIRARARGGGARGLVLLGVGVARDSLRRGLLYPVEPRGHASIPCPALFSPSTSLGQARRLAL